MSIISNYLAQFFNIIKNFISLAVSNDGAAYFLAVVVFTGLVKVVLWPLNMKQMRSQAAMTEIQPELKKIQTKFKDDPAKVQAKTMELYKEHNVSPFASCLPMLIQMPILFALFYVFRDLKGIEGIRFLWIPSLALKDTTYILPILSGLTTYIQSAMMAPKPEEGKPNQSFMMNIMMSAFMVFISINFSSILILYWIINNIFQILQNYIIIIEKKKKTKTV